MTLFPKAILLVAALALAACNNPRGGDDFDTGFGGAGGISSTALGDPNDPTSIAYFNETIGDTVNFTVDSSDLSAQAQVILRTQAAWLNRYPQYSIVIEGHADERGTREYNIALSARRATAAREFLIAQGVAARRISSIAYGKERPAALCDAEQCWSQNRRAVTVITGGAKTS